MMFTIMWPYTHKEVKYLESINFPRAIPFEIVATHEAQANANHQQTLARLNERGGLSLCELCAVLDDRPWRPMPRDEAVSRIMRAITESSDAK